MSFEDPLYWKTHKTLKKLIVFSYFTYNHLTLLLATNVIPLGLTGRIKKVNRQSVTVLPILCACGFLYNWQQFFPFIPGSPVAVHDVKVPASSGLRSKWKLPSSDIEQTQPRPQKMSVSPWRRWQARTYVTCALATSGLLFFVLFLRWKLTLLVGDVFISQPLKAWPGVWLF